MNVILTCAFPQPGYELPHQALEAAGLSAARCARGQDLAPAALLDSIVDSHRIERDSASIQQLVPGKRWQELATDLFRENVETGPWGWVESRLIYLLDFWHAFEPQIGFVLAYNPPAAVVGEVLRGQQVTEADVAGVLAAWCAFNAELLRFYYSNRQRCLLVNASSVRHAPEALVGLVVRAFGVDLTIPAAGSSSLPARAADARLLEYLAQELLQDRDDARALYEEFESTADMPLALLPSPSSPWNDYAAILAASAAQLRTQSDRTDALETERASLATGCRVLEQEIETLTHAHAEQAGAAAQRQVQLEALDKTLNEQRQRASALSARIRELECEVESQRQARVEHAKLAAERQTQVEALNAARAELEQQRSALVTRRCELERDIETLLRERDEQSRVIAECHRQLATAQSASTPATLELAETKAQYMGLLEENELLLLQLHQVEEELERYYLENRALLDGTRNLPPAPLAASELVPAEILYDLRQEIDGENWYYAEHDGRWAGPEMRSTLRVPALPPGHYRLELCAVDAMEPEILFGMSMSLNDVPIAIAVPDDNRYPKLVQADFTVAETDVAPVWQFAFTFSKLVSPAERGSDDQRHLAIRLASLCLRVADETAPWSKTSPPIPWWAIWKRRR